MNKKEFIAEIIKKIIEIKIVQKGTEITMLTDDIYNLYDSHIEEKVNERLKQKGDASKAILNISDVDNSEAVFCCDNCKYDKEKNFEEICKFCYLNNCFEAK